MILDFNRSSGTFNLLVDRGEADVIGIMQDHGFDFSRPASSSHRACLFTRNKYAALAFREHATIDAISALALNLAEVEASWAETSNAHIKTPADQELWPFQRAGVEYVMRRNSGALIGDQPGLGKTAQAICVANEMGAKRALCIVPANIRLQWAKQIRTWSTMLGRPIIYPIMKGKDGVHPHAHWTILSYDLTRSAPIYDALMRGTYDLVILDEAHFLKTPDAKRTRQVLSESGLSSRCGFVLGLTGTPLPNKPRECYTLARAICWDSIDWLSEDKFNERFNPRAVFEKRDESGRLTSRFSKEKTGRLPELQNRLRSHFMVRRLKRQVLKQLPPVRFEIINLEETGAVRKALEAESLLHIDPLDLAGVDAKILGHVATVRKMMGIAIAPQVADYVATLLDGGEEKLLVAGWHIEALDILQERLHKYGLVRVDGRTSPTKKQISVDTFVKEPGIRVFLGNMQSIGTGTDGLQKVCSHAVIAEASWTPGDNEQTISRLERIGQNEAIIGSFMTVAGSFSERVLSSSLTKMQNIHSTLDKDVY